MTRARRLGRYSRSNERRNVRGPRASVGAPRRCQNEGSPRGRRPRRDHRGRVGHAPRGVAACARRTRYVARAGRRPPRRNARDSPLRSVRRLDTRPRMDRSAMGSTPRALRARASRRRLGGRLLRGRSRARRTLDRGRARAEARRDSSQYGSCALVPCDRRALDGAGAHSKLRGRAVPGRVRAARARRALTVAPRALGRTAAGALGEPSWLRRARSGSRSRSRGSHRYPNAQSPTSQRPACGWLDVRGLCIAIRARSAGLLPLDAHSPAVRERSDRMGTSVVQQAQRDLLLSPPSQVLPWASRNARR